LSDIFREVEEDVRREKLEKLWKNYGAYLMVLVVLLLAGVAGFQIWQRYEAGLRDKDSAAFMAAQHVANPKAAAAAFATLVKNGHGGYVAMARLEQANVMAGSGQPAQAIALYKEIAEGDHGAVGAVARLRAGWLMADTAPHADLQTLLQPLLDPGSVWLQMAQEILAYSDYRAGKTLAATAEFGKLATDPSAPDELRARAQAFAAFLTTGGAANHGTVPPPAPVPSPLAPSPATAPAAAMPAGAATP
jgi:hypothetical protein